MPTKAQQREETTARLVATARELFAEKGYAHVSLAGLVTAAGVTKGALYHYFTGKDDLFRAVLAQVHAEVAARVETATAGTEDTGPWAALVRGCTTWLSAATDPAVRQIMLVDAPSVLGWAVWRDLDAQTSHRHLTDILTRLVDDGVLPRRPVTPLAHLLSGAMNEAALWISTSADPRRDLDDATTALVGLLEALRGTRGQDR